MKKLLLALSLLALVLTESNTNAIFGMGRYADTSAKDYPDCCVPKRSKKGCRDICCRGSLIGRPRWSCCRTLRCCVSKNVCCPRYKCCPRKRRCCPQEVPVCETTGCVTTPTSCNEDYTGTPYGNGTTSYSGEYANSYPTSYGQPMNEIV